MTDSISKVFRVTWKEDTSLNSLDGDPHCNAEAVFYALNHLDCPSACPADVEDITEQVDCCVETDCNRGEHA